MFRDIVLRSWKMCAPGKQEISNASTKPHHNTATTIFTSANILTHGLHPSVLNPHGSAGEVSTRVKSIIGGFPKVFSPLIHSHSPEDPPSGLSAGGSTPNQSVIRPIRKLHYCLDDAECSEELQPSFSRPVTLGTHDLGVASHAQLVESIISRVFSPLKAKEPSRHDFG